MWKVFHGVAWFGQLSQSGLMTIGTCKLTGEVGLFVKAHIIPQALSYGAAKDMPFAQAGADHPPIKRWTSWYDPNIVTRAGEDILAKYDDWAIEELRRHKLVWSSWSGHELNASDYLPIPGNNEGWGFREIHDLNGARLRLFFLSVLWRAAVSEMREFQEVQIPHSQMRRLRRMLIEGDPEPFHVFPISLTQLSTRGRVHNLTPIAQRKQKSILQPKGATIPIFRFYFDGLIAHIHRESNRNEVQDLGGMLLGTNTPTAICTVKYENSWQQGNMRELEREAEERWPERLANIRGFGR
jgi:hypothetical protein